MATMPARLAEGSEVIRIHGSDLANPQKKRTLAHTASMATDFGRYGVDLPKSTKLCSARLTFDGSKQATPPPQKQDSTAPANLLELTSLVLPARSKVEAGNHARPN